MTNICSELSYRTPFLNFLKLYIHSNLASLRHNLGKISPYKWMDLNNNPNRMLFYRGSCVNVIIRHILRIWKFSIFLFNFFLFLRWHVRFPHLISRSRTCSDNRREKGKVLERHKAAGTPTQPRIKINKAKTFKYTSRVVC